jgi:DeoR/GlpR family transcriptional regulator of sugar metabolism
MNTSKGHPLYEQLETTQKGTLNVTAALAKCSRDTALRDINELLACGLLRKLEGGCAAADMNWCGRRAADGVNCVAL